MSMDRQAGSPPQDITTASDLLAKMRAGTRAHHEIRMRDLVIPVRILSIDEVNTVRRDAVFAASAIKNGDAVDKNVLVQKYTLVLASKVGQVSLLSEKLLGQLSVDEVNYLYEEYMKVMDDMNPSVEMMSQEELRDLIDAVKKNSVTVRTLSLRQLRVIFSVFQDLIQKPELPDSPKDS